MTADRQRTEAFAIPADGSGLPPGSGTADQGAIVYRERCAASHGEHLEGSRAAGGEPLIGGRGSLTGPMPQRTVESYWPYATTLFDYVKRAMPFPEPDSLTDGEVYGVVAYILAQARSGQVRDGDQQRVEAIVQRQQRVPPEGDDDGLLLDR